MSHKDTLPSFDPTASQCVDLAAWSLLCWTVRVWAHEAITSEGLASCWNPPFDASALLLDSEEIVANAVA